jgi:hypothetical protein
MMADETWFTADDAKAPASPTPHRLERQALRRAATTKAAPTFETSTAYPKRSGHGWI